MQPKSAVEIVARALALAHVKGRFIGSDLTEHAESRAQTYVDRRWREHESEARVLLRTLKDQPTRILNTAANCYSFAGILNEILEAMASEVCA